MRRIAILLAVLSVATSLHAAPSNDPFADDGAVPDIAIVTPKPRAGTAAPAPVGNPLWSVPLSALTATPERPLFTPSRRPPPRAVVAAPAPKPIQTAPPTVQAPLALSLIGAVVGDDDAVAVFVDRNTQGIVRLRAGQTHDGWSLTAIEPRAATLTRGAQSETLPIRRNDATAPAPGFIPRSTPKNGEPDGL